MLLPPLRIEIRKNELNERERDFYDCIYKQSRSRFDDYVDQGTLLHNYAHIFDLLSRLRQAVDHPYLVVHGNHANKTVSPRLSCRQQHSVTALTGTSYIEPHHATPCRVADRCDTATHAWQGRLTRSTHTHSYTMAGRVWSAGKAAAVEEPRWRGHLWHLPRWVRPRARSLTCAGCNAFWPRAATECATQAKLHRDAFAVTHAGAAAHTPAVKPHYW